MIALSEVSKSYYSTRVLEHVHLQLGKGDFLYVVGGSGAGKSSLLRIIATEEQASSGQVSLFGYDLSKIGSGTLRAIRRSIGYIPQNIRLISDLSAFDNVALSLHLAGSRVLTRNLKSKVQETLVGAGLKDKMETAVSKLSGGEAQRVAVARAMVRSPEIIIADEPTGSQDRAQTWQIMQSFVRANGSSTTVLIATHDREIVRRVPRKCAIIQRGTLSVGDASACMY